MKRSKALIWSVFALILTTGFICSSIALANKPTPSKKKQVSKAVPSYRPPMRGAPTRRVGGGVRGTEGDLPFLAVLVPEHTGLAINPQPTLYWYLSKPWKGLMEFTLNEADGFEPLVEIEFTTKKFGVQPIRLADHSLMLKPGLEYEWFVAIISDSDERSGDVIASGMIKRVDFSADLKKRLTQTPKAEHHYLYAEAGLWYDTIAALNSLIESNPENADLRKQRAALLKQIGLYIVAEYDDNLVPIK